MISEVNGTSTFSDPEEEEFLHGFQAISIANVTEQSVLVEPKMPSEVTNAAVQIIKGYNEQVLKDEVQQGRSYFEVKPCKKTFGINYHPSGK